MSVWGGEGPFRLRTTARRRANGERVATFQCLATGTRASAPAGASGGVQAQRGDRAAGGAAPGPEVGVGVAGAGGDQQAARPTRSDHAGRPDRYRAPHPFHRQALPGGRAPAAGGLRGSLREGRRPPDGRHRSPRSGGGAGKVRAQLSLPILVSEDAAEGFGEPAAVGFPERAKPTLLSPLSTARVDATMSTPSLAGVKNRMAVRRRGKGEGTLYERSDGRWGATVTLLDGRRRTVYARTRAEAQTKLHELTKRREQGLLNAGAEQKVAEYLRGWLEDVARASIRPRTYEAYGLNVRRALPHIGHIRLGELTPAQVQAAYGELLRSGLSARSVNHVHRVLHRAFVQAVRWNLIPRNPTDAALSPRPEPTEMKVLTADQVRDLLAATEGDRFHALWVLLVSTGLRVGEALGLRWGDLDPTGRLRIVRGLQRQRDRGLVFVEPKTRRSRRTLQLSPTAVAALDAHRRRQVAERLAAGPAWEDGDLIFPGIAGKPFEASGVNKRLDAALSEAGLPRIRVHDLRHTAASLLLARGVHPKIVQEMLGHSTITLTLDTYSHVTPGLHAAAAAEMEAVLGGG